MLKVLVVEDAPLMRSYLTEHLHEIHCGFVTAACARDGMEALQILSSGLIPDVIITDIKMPRMDGLELAAYVCRSMPQIAVIILTGYDEFEYAKRAMKYSVMDYLLKPLNDAELYEVLQKIAARRGVEAAAASGAPASSSPEEAAGALSARAVSYIQSHFQSPLSLTDVADALNVTAAYLCNVFHAETGETYSKFILRLRMEKAAQLLQTQPASKVYSIAAEVGYVSPKHFNLVFKKYYGLTPGEYREQVRQHAP